MLVVTLLLGGLELGFLAGRWWVVVVPVAFGVWVATTTDVEVPPWFLGSAYALASAIGVLAGVWLRHLATRKPR